MFSHEDEKHRDSSHEAALGESCLKSAGSARPPRRISGKSFPYRPVNCQSVSNDKWPLAKGGRDAISLIDIGQSLTRRSCAIFRDRQFLIGVLY